MLRVYEDQDLPPVFRAQVKIRRQPFFGAMDFEVIRARWVGSHQLWLVGDAVEVSLAFAECNREYLALMDRHGCYTLERY
jgi:hypothetical protein